MMDLNLNTVIRHIRSAGVADRYAKIDLPGTPPPGTAGTDLYVHGKPQKVSRWDMAESIDTHDVPHIDFCESVCLSVRTYSPDSEDGILWPVVFWGRDCPDASFIIHEGPMLSDTMHDLLYRLLGYSKTERSYLVNPEKEVSSGSFPRNICRKCPFPKKMNESDENTYAQGLRHKYIGKNFIKRGDGKYKLVLPSRPYQWGCLPCGKRVKRDLSEVEEPTDSCHLELANKWYEISCLTATKLVNGKLRASKPPPNNVEPLADAAYAYSIIEHAVLFECKYLTYEKVLTLLQYAKNFPWPWLGFYQECHPERFLLQGKDLTAEMVGALMTRPLDLRVPFSKAKVNHTTEAETCARTNLFNALAAALTSEEYF